MNSKRVDMVRKTAAAWYLRLSGPVVDQQELERFEIWCGEGADHRAAYDQVVATLDEFDAIAESSEVTALMEQTRKRLTSTKPTAWSRQALAKAASLLLCIGIAVWLGLSQITPVHESFQTAADQRKTVQLSDGSHLTLDADTLVEADFSRDIRALRLERGQARFRVAHDTSRPFQVAIGERTVTATGTDFNIERLPGRSVVTLLTGGVTIAFEPPASWLSRTFGKNTVQLSTELHPGQRIDIPDTGNARIRRVNPQDVIAWERGWIAFDDEPLDLAIERFNRYSQRKVRLEVGLPADHTVSGRFAISDPNAFAGAAAQLFGLSKFEGDDGTIRLRSSR